MECSLKKRAYNTRRFEHFNFEQRKIINNHVSKEVKRNRFVSKEAARQISDSICPITLRFPYVCNACNKRSRCHFRQYRYEARVAQQKADCRLVIPRKGINLTQEEFHILDKKIKDGLNNKESIYHIVNSNDDIHVSVSSVYNYINHHLLSSTRMDLPYAVSLKKRKIYKKVRLPRKQKDRSQ